MMRGVLFYVVLAVALFLVFGQVQSKVIDIPLKSKLRQIDFKHILNVTETATGRKRYNTVSPLEGCASNDFSVVVSLGTTPTQNIECIVDTGSTTTAVASSLCTNCGTGPTYTPGSSSGKIPGTVSSTYGDGSGWSGDIYVDDVSVGGMGSVRINFAAIKSQTSFFPTEGCFRGSPPEYRGILGMGYPALLETDTTSYFDEVIAGGELEQDMFTIQMCDNTGHLWLGGYDPEYMSGALLYTPVTRQDYWVVDMTDLQFDGTSIGYTRTDFGTSIVDSGTTLLILPNNVYNTFVNRITSAPNWGSFFPANFFSSGYCNTVPGETDASLNFLLPPMNIVIGSGPNAVKLTMSPVSSYLMKTSDGTNTYYCPGIASGSMTILGWSAMNQFTTVFDRANNQVGFAVTRGCPGRDPYSSASILPSSMLLNSIISLFLMSGIASFLF